MGPAVAPAGLSPDPKGPSEIVTRRCSPLSGPLPLAFFSHPATIRPSQPPHPCPPGYCTSEKKQTPLQSVRRPVFIGPVQATQQTKRSQRCLASATCRSGLPRTGCACHRPFALHPQVPAHPSWTRSLLVTLKCLPSLALLTKPSAGPPRSSLPLRMCQGRSGVCNI
ncbi:hypothetical protein COCSADRAFT_335854 [Bipolaris sorokiniana ND90Pr]|uniref:Uncharacterized protein n=1 Tax=Cochliobolus sativus (strain ND90Pr / ATCC 201652) TaxID=665912 RepID=M2SKZ9_COCSN|nr:uncharacterized protein COCSADRAFT_335854 [Bipolaris sorokiniana ND90Pr]EMD62960.1 hypothetical protein COCSADRAFT_335854 [Bipolaris sorokiniana ND90Pr]